MSGDHGLLPKNDIFSGSLQLEKNKTAVSFSLDIDTDGKARIQPIPWSSLGASLEFREELDLLKDQPFTKIKPEGRSSSGEFFICFDFLIQSDAAEVIFEVNSYELEQSIPEEPGDFVMQFVRPSIRYPIPFTAKMSSGTLAIISTAATENHLGFTVFRFFPNKCNESEMLNATQFLDFLIQAVGFSQGINLRTICTDHRTRGKSYRKYQPVNFKDEYSHVQPIIHHRDLHGFFITICNCYESLTGRKKVLSSSFRSFTSPNIQLTSAFLNAFTLLEYLTSSLLDPEDIVITNDELFGQLSNILKSAIKQSKLLTKDQRQKTYSKLRGLQRESIRNKISKYFQSRSLAMDQIISNSLKKIIDTRDSLVHMGEAEASDLSPKELLNYLDIINEIITRMLLKEINYQGRYFSHYKFTEVRIFPDCIIDKESPLSDYYATKAQKQREIDRHI